MGLGAGPVRSPAAVAQGGEGEVGRARKGHGQRRRHRAPMEEVGVDGLGPHRRVEEGPGSEGGREAASRERGCRWDRRRGGRRRERGRNLDP